MGSGQFHTEASIPPNIMNTIAKGYIRYDIFFSIGTGPSGS